MTIGIFDSSVVIDCLRGRANAIAFLAAQSVVTRPRTHVLVAAEVLTGARDKREQMLIDLFLKTFDIAVPNEADALHALDPPPSLLVSADRAFMGVCFDSL